jgi:hypothetical protein
VVTNIQYYAGEIDYATWDSAGYETLRLTSKPLQVTVDGSQVGQQSSLSGQAWTWTPLDTGGALRLHRTGGKQVKISWYPLSVDNSTETGFDFNIFPNPARGLATIKFALPAGEDFVINMLSIDGRNITGIKSETATGRGSYDLDISNLGKGIYLVQMKSNGYDCVKKLIVF